ncbi:hypothetical protein GUITHDRAFT_147318 [Guillardia theta CCMP2712]|uniref:YubB ferredoxin-like domain-containing protein n=1 Tax=Guillardia theta (strain CCMP2712) TaxID=905079 RepID=L1IEH6_GUITC|nr:hypothetical protein GUITHDRAFT_147318 [Guillardia theta CCMP2712]EKX34279.1 hypothetical protein GUITHDRAFT_147318 [Guillardia theta CCMP2712]|eukprot:XP_005821259.1 hypothetical protein GUITHDRAFT_147318 [Guillardia theta CCMP2712]
MPDMCFNSVVMCAANALTAESFETFLKGLQPDDEIGLFGHFLPRPASVDWFLWSNQHWGTKWDVPQLKWERNNLSFHLKFETAWAPPVAFYEFLESADGGDWMIDAIFHSSAEKWVGRYACGSQKTWKYNFEDPTWRDRLPHKIVDEAELDREYAEWLEWKESCRKQDQ